MVVSLMKPSIYILFFISSVIILIQFILDPNIIVNNDLNGNIVPLLHFKESILKYGIFPQWNPFINQGIPSVADPLYGIYNPIISIPILLLPYQLAIKAMYFISVFIACISMFLLARLYKISNTVSVIISITYASGAYLASRIIAGHLEKVVSFAFLPLFIFCLVKTAQTKNILWSGVTAITLSLIFFSGDIYNALFSLYLAGAVFLYYLFKDRKVSFHLALAVVLFLAFSSIKILPMIQLQDHISKIKEPFVGGLDIYSIIFNLFLPFEFLFPDTLIKESFGWWESLAFIGPLSILGLFFIFKVAFFDKHNKKTSILIILTVLFILLSTPDSPLNPIHYLISIIEPLQYFHVPSRILMYWGIIILVSLGVFIDKWKNKKFAIGLLLINLLIVYTFSQNVLSTRKFEEINKEYRAVLDWIRDNNEDNYYTVHKQSQGEIPQDKAYSNKILLLQSNYGLFLKESLGEKYNFKGLNPYNDIKPGFLISNISTKSSNLIMLRKFRDDIFLYRDLRALPFARINKNSQKVNFTPNKITVIANSNKKSHLILLETNYPGWKAFVDNERIEILKGRFLEVESLPGEHKYEFIYSSAPFHYGLLMSGVSLGSWIIIIFKKRKLFHKK